MYPYILLVQLRVKFRHQIKMLELRHYWQRNHCMNMLLSIAASGLGYGIVSGAFATVNIFRDLGGPGTVGIAGDSQYFFIISCKC